MSRTGQQAYPLRWSISLTPIIAGLGRGRNCGTLREWPGSSCHDGAGTCYGRRTHHGARAHL